MPYLISDEDILEMKKRLASIDAFALVDKIVIEKQAQQIADLQAENKTLRETILNEISEDVDNDWL